jgi:hypothetical protein
MSVRVEALRNRRSRAWRIELYYVGMRSFFRSLVYRGSPRRFFNPNWRGGGPSSPDLRIDWPGTVQFAYHTGQPLGRELASIQR